MQTFLLSPESINFTFPLNLAVGMQFSTTKEVVELIDQEAFERDIRVRHFANRRRVKTNHHNFILNCRYCKAVLQFSHREGALHATVIDSQHNHPPHPIESRNAITRWYLRAEMLRFPLTVYPGLQLASVA